MLTALVDTTKQVLTGPAEFFRSMPVTGGIGAPLVYGLILGYLGLVASTIYNTVFQSVLGSSMAGMGSTRWERIAPFVEGGAGLVVNLVFGPLFIAVGLFLSAGIFHLVLLALGSGGRGFEATFRTAAYSQAAAIFNAVPLCGGVIGAVYTIVLLVIGISEVHQISRGKAAAVVLLPLVILCCCCAGSLGMALGGLAGLLSRTN
ncbi:MAG TPA: YIP1 family protein [Vicinamibacteria bacterium]|nr:YIP1 family protein [Vicinamibacteria bacterium]